MLSTARDIMGLWVARMVMSSLYFTDQIPFKDVIIHPTVMAADGKPMSKSRGNGVDPLKLMQDYGADGMRFGLLMQVTGAQDLKFNENKLGKQPQLCQQGSQCCSLREYESGWLRSWRA